MTHPYEPAAQIAENAALETTPEIRRVEGLYIAAQIRALPHPPERVLPVFTGMQLRNNCGFHLGEQASESLASFINQTIAASGFAQSGQVDLQKMPGAHSSVIPCHRGGHLCNWPACSPACDGRPGADRKDAAVGKPPPDTKGADDRVELLLRHVTVLEYALLDVAKQARPLREWGGNVAQVMIAARKNGWEGTGK
jgi:hypothetical protein